MTGDTNGDDLASGRVRTLRTVLVDDVDEMRDLVRTLLARDGRFTVVGEASDGHDAIAVVADVHPDLVVLDVGMPTLDGIATRPRLREISPETRIVMLSGFPAERMEQPSLTGGAIGYVEKGSDLERLPSQLHALVNFLSTVQSVLDRTYANEVTSARSARRDLRTALEAKVAPTSLDTVELLTSELVSNAVEHASSTARVTAEITGGRIRVSVTDDGPGMPVVRGGVSVQGDGGRGLAIVDRLAAGWGVQGGDAGKTVWFELDL